MGSTPEREIPEKFLVSFSFAGEQRNFVRSLAESVEARLGTGTVFFDEWFEYYIAGPDADKRLQQIYGAKSELVVVCVSSSYGNKEWTLAEYEAIRALTIKRRTSPHEQDGHRILPLRVGEGDVEGIPFTTIIPDIRRRSPEHTRDLIINKLRLIRPDIGASQKPARVDRRVYLAECTPDLDDPDKPINRRAVKAFLENIGWTVLPESEYTEDEYASRLEDDLRRCMAFIQLRGPYPWRRGGFDRVQNDAAAKLNLPRILYRSSEINLSKVEPADHREFLSASGVIADGFDDFLRYLEKQLALLASKADRERDPAQNGEPCNRPLVRVVTRSANPDPLWDHVFRWIYEQEKILSELLAPHESFEAIHEADPCHGFLVICDSAALDDGPMSPRDHMKQCRRIQFRHKEQEKRPPVAVVYWPPPDPSWPRLLRVQPDKLYCAAVEGVPPPQPPPELGQFFAEVRRVAQ